jgi:hypothetical protein
MTDTVIEVDSGIVVEVGPAFPIPLPVPSGGTGATTGNNLVPAISSGTASKVLSNTGNGAPVWTNSPTLQGLTVNGATNVFGAFTTTAVVSMDSGAITTDGRGNLSISGGTMTTPTATVVDTLQHGSDGDGDLGFFGANPVGQQPTPVTLADVIALLRSYGLCP